MKLKPDEIRHYARHLTLPDVGVAGQLKLKQATVLLIGAGGLGSPAAQYLAAAGIGRIKIIDPDVVELSNLQRQVIHDTSTVGKAKVASAKARMLAINPHIQVEAIADMIDDSNIADLMADCDIVIDGTDNFAARLLINRASVKAGKPLVFGAVHQFTGQVTVFNLDDAAPCYRCLFPNLPSGDLAPNCAAGGVIGVLPGQIGLWQASEAIKIILGIGQPLSGRMVVLDMLAGNSRELKFSKRSDCRECGQAPACEPIDAVCAATPIGDPLPIEHILSPQAFKHAIEAMPDAVLLDVREPGELEICRLPNARNIPVGQLERRLSDLPAKADYLVFCKSGGRSSRAVHILKRSGITSVKHMDGGLLAWARQVDPDLVIV